MCQSNLILINRQIWMWTRIDHRIFCAGASIKFEVGSWLKKNNRLYEQGAVRPINLAGSGGMLPQKILKSGGSEMPFSSILEITVFAWPFDVR